MVDENCFVIVYDADPETSKALLRQYQKEIKIANRLRVRLGELLHDSRVQIEVRASGVNLLTNGVGPIEGYTFNTSIKPWSIDDV